jgi:hypothetical protein
VSPENLAVIYRVYEAMNRQDVAALEELDMPESQLRVGRESGAEVERDEVHFWRTVDGRIAGLDEFLTVEEAREAAAQP